MSVAAEMCYSLGYMSADFSQWFKTYLTNRCMLCGRKQYGMIILELSSYLLEIPIDAYTTLSQFWLAAQHSAKSTASWSVNIGSKCEDNFKH